MGKVLLAKIFPLTVKLVGKALQEEQAENEFLELRGIHLAAQNIGGLEEKRFQLR